MKGDSKTSVHTHTHMFKQVVSKAILMEILKSARKDMEYRGIPKPKMIVDKY